jgi:hypothetical protein
MDDYQLIEYKMSNTDKIYLITCSVLFVGVLLMANSKLKVY